MLVLENELCSLSFLLTSFVWGKSECTLLEPACLPTCLPDCFCLSVAEDNYIFYWRDGMREGEGGGGRGGREGGRGR